MKSIRLVEDVIARCLMIALMACEARIVPVLGFGVSLLAIVLSQSIFRAMTI